MLKTEPFDCAINKKFCSVDGGRDICHSRQKKMLMPGGQPGGGCWAQGELTDALVAVRCANDVFSLARKIVRPHGGAEFRAKFPDFCMSVQSCCALASGVNQRGNLICSVNFP